MNFKSLFYLLQINDSGKYEVHTDLIILNYKKQPAVLIDSLLIIKVNFRGNVTSTLHGFIPSIILFIFIMFVNFVWQLQEVFGKFWECYIIASLFNFIMHFSNCISYLLMEKLIIILHDLHKLSSWPINLLMPTARRSSSAFSSCPCSVLSVSSCSDSVLSHSSILLLSGLYFGKIIVYVDLVTGPVPVEDCYLLYCIYQSSSA